jgi:hypothetical protein
MNGYVHRELSKFNKNKHSHRVSENFNTETKKENMARKQADYSLLIKIINEMLKKKKS